MLPLIGLFSIITAFEYFELPIMQIPDNMFFLLYSGGVAIGCSVIGPLSDRYARTKPLLVSCLLAVGLSVYGCFADDTFDYGFVIGGYGLCGGSYYSVAIVYLIEIYPPEYAKRYCTLFHLFVPACNLIAKALCLKFSLWPIILSLACYPSIVFLLASRYLWESPSFLFAIENYSQALVNLNGISAFNSGKKARVDDINEGMQLARDMVELDESRRRAFFQYPYLWRYDSSRAYLLLFSALGFFTSLPLAGLSQQVEKDYLIPSLPAIALIFLFLLQNKLKSRSIMTSLLYLLFIIGIINATLLLYFGKLYQLITCLLYLLSFMSVIQCLIFIAENSPCRVRGTSFGLACGVCTISGVIGESLGFSSENAITLFSLSSLIAIGVLKLAKKFEVINKGCNDIYEVFDVKKKRYKNIPVRHNINHSYGKDPNLKYFSLIDMHTEIERCPDETSMASIEVLFTHPGENFVRIPVEGCITHNEIEEDIGISWMKVFKSGLLIADGRDSKGKFIMEGHIVNHNSFCFAKIQNEVIGVQYNGKKEGCVIKGKWNEGNKAGDFWLHIKGKEWKGTFSIGGNSVPIEWMLCIEGKTLSGIYDSKDSLYLLKGDIKEDGKLFVTMADTLGNEKEFTGYITEDRIHGKNEGRNTMIFDLSPSII